MKKYTLLVFAFLFCELLFGQTLKIKIYNKTFYDLDSVIIENTYVGCIKKGASVMVLNCPQLTLQTGMPYGVPQASIKNKTRNKEPSDLEDYEKTIMNAGSFKFDIIALENSEGYNLYWRNH